jgi:hypothetical protein
MLKRDSFVVNTNLCYPCRDEKKYSTDQSLDI